MIGYSPYKQIPQNDRSLYCYYSKSSIRYCDPLDVLEALEMIQEIILEERMVLSSKQRNFLKNDLLNLSSKSEETCK